jgi:hypothetical protein
VRPLVEGAHHLVFSIDRVNSLGELPSVWRNALASSHLISNVQRRTFNVTPSINLSIDNTIAKLTMSNDVSPEAMQTRIQQARREAENLKDRIKRKKDDLADGTRK